MFNPITGDILASLKPHSLDNPQKVPLPPKAIVCLHIDITRNTVGIRRVKGLMMYNPTPSAMRRIQELCIDLCLFKGWQCSPTTGGYILMPPLERMVIG